MKFTNKKNLYKWKITAILLALIFIAILGKGINRFYQHQLVSAPLQIHKAEIHINKDMDATAPQDPIVSQDNVQKENSESKDVTSNNNLPTLGYNTKNNTKIALVITNLGTNLSLTKEAINLPKEIALNRSHCLQSTTSIRPVIRCFFLSWLCPTKKRC